MFRYLGLRVWVFGFRVKNNTGVSRKRVPNSPCYRTSPKEGPNLWKAPTLFSILLKQEECFQNVIFIYY